MKNDEKVIVPRTTNDFSVFSDHRKKIFDTKIVGHLAYTLHFKMDIDGQTSNPSNIAFHLRTDK